MASRNMMKTAKKMEGQSEKNKYLYCYELSLEELDELYELSQDNTREALITAFNYGFVLGTRAHSKGVVKAL